MTYPPILDFAPLLIWTIAVLWVQNAYEHSKEEREDIMYLAIMGAILWLIIGICV